jgi:Bacteriophage baseplate protein W
MSTRLSTLVSWPLEPEFTDGRLLYAGNNQSIREVIWNILATRPGERVMRPEFGSGLYNYIHQPNNETTRNLLKDAVVRGVTRWEPRVELIDVQVLPDPESLSQVNISIHYRVRQDGNNGRLDFNLQLGSG